MGREGNCCGDVGLDGSATSAPTTRSARIAELVHGGPWEIFINTYELDGPRPAAIEIDLDGFASRIRIGDNVELELDVIRNPARGPRLQRGFVRDDEDVSREGRRVVRALGQVRGPRAVRVRGVAVGEARAPRCAGQRSLRARAGSRAPLAPTADALERLDLLEAAAGTEGDTQDRRLGDVDRQLGLVT